VCKQKIQYKGQFSLAGNKAIQEVTSIQTISFNICYSATLLIIVKLIQSCFTQALEKYALGQSFTRKIAFMKQRKQNYSDGKPNQTVTI
jgi:hypothetical protein